MHLSERTKAILLTVAVVSSAATLILSAQALQPRPPTLTRGISLSLRVEGPGWTIEYTNNETRNNTVYLFLLEAARTLHFGLDWTNYSPPLSAIFVLSINGSRNGEGGRFWQFWVGDVYGTLAADLTILHGGDDVVWRFVASQEG